MIFIEFLRILQTERVSSLLHSSTVVAVYRADEQARGRTHSFEYDPCPLRAFGIAATVARGLCSARDSAEILEPHPNALCHRPDWLRLTVEGVRSSIPCVANLSLFGLIGESL